MRLRQFGIWTLLVGVCSLASATSASAGIVIIDNPGFEDGNAPSVGATGWTITSGGTDWFTTTAGAPDSSNDPDAAFEGSQWLSGNRLATGAGSSSNPQTISQLIDISADSALIDSGLGQLSLNFQFSDSDQNDEATVNVSFFSDVGGTTEIGTPLTTGVIDPTGADGEANAPWELRSLAGLVPTLARSLQIEIVNQRLGGSAGNVHFDAFAGEIAAVPEPGSMTAIGFLAAGCVLRRRKR